MALNHWDVLKQHRQADQPPQKRRRNFHSVDTAWDATVRRRAVLYFTTSPDPHALDVLVAALADSDNKVRSYAVSGLGKRDDPRARSALIDFRKREKEKPDIKALFTNASMRTLKDVSSPAVMAKLLQHRHSPVRLQAAQALHKAAGEAATKAALAAFNHPDPAVRRGHCRLDEGSG